MISHALVALSAAAEARATKIMFAGGAIMLRLVLLQQWLAAWLQSQRKLPLVSRVTYQNR